MGNAVAIIVLPECSIGPGILGDPLVVDFGVLDAGEEREDGVVVEGGEDVARDSDIGKGAVGKSMEIVVERPPSLLVDAKGVERGGRGGMEEGDDQ